MKCFKNKSGAVVALLAIGLNGYVGPAQAWPGYKKAGAPAATAPKIFGLKPFGSGTGMDELIPKIEVQADESLKSPIVEGKPRPNDFWWPTLLDVSPLRQFESVNPLGADFSYPKAFAKLNMKAVKADLRALMKDSKSWWPADYGHYGPLFIRMAWHSAGTYRALDGRGGADGGQQRFEPLNSWPDNANLDKSRRLIQPLVDKYYPNLSWADAMVLAGDEAMRDMGFKTLGFAGGREDDWTPDLVYWGPEDRFLESRRFNSKGELLLPLAASVMGLIYVNPEGPDGKPDPLLAAERIRTTFGRMGMNDEETVALIAGGHTFGKAHGARKAEGCVEAPAPADAPTEAQLLGWRNKCGKGNAEDTITSGIEGAWTPDPVRWTHEFLTKLYKYDWSLQKGPGGKFQWFAKNLEAADHAPNAHKPGEKAPIMMLTTDIALKLDPKYNVISTRFLQNPTEFEEAFAAAWFKLTHRDLGPKSRYLGNDFPKKDFIWQDPTPAVTHPLVGAKDVAKLKVAIRKSSLSISDLIKTAWAGAASYRGSDMKGGLNGARLRLAPQKDWEVNEPELLKKNLTVLETIRAQFNKNSPRTKVSLADLIVIAGNVAVEDAAKKAGMAVEVAFVPGRTDASQEQTDITGINYFKVTNDGFRNFYRAKENYLNPANAFIDRAAQLTLTVPEMTVLIGGLRVLGANHAGSPHGVFTKNPGALTNDFFVNLMDMSTVWSLADEENGVFEGKNRESGAKLWTATTHDLIFGSRSELRAVAFTYASQNAKTRFVHDFAKAWTKVMSLDRFDKKSL
ncbi:MAG TPA: catalase/peroxidase HPI [Bacteriovoracaceae bacterium]|nr:catalase/peroxidase HPI [Bacteriovoracaceae bacterium]